MQWGAARVAPVQCYWKGLLHPGRGRFINAAILLCSLPLLLLLALPCSALLCLPALCLLPALCSAFSVLPAPALCPPLPCLLPSPATACSLPCVVTRLSARAGHSAPKTKVWAEHVLAYSCSVLNRDCSCKP